MRVLMIEDDLGTGPDGEPIAIPVVGDLRSVRLDDYHRLGNDPPQSDVLRSHIYALRRAIDTPFDRDLLHTVRSYGYQLAAR